MVAVIMLALAMLQGRIRQDANTADFSSSPLIEGLQIEAVSAITIASEKGEKTITFNRKDGTFTVADLDDYPVDVTAVNNLINGCLDVRAQEKITDNPDNHPDLEVTPETAQYVVSFSDADGGLIVAILISKSNEKGEAFVRLLSEEAVYSVQYPPSVRPNPMDYVDAQLLQLSREDIYSIAVRTGGDSYILTVSADGGDIELKDMPPGKQYKGTLYKTVFGALSSLRFENVEHASEQRPFDSVYTCKLKDKTVYKLELAQEDDTAWAKVSAEFVGQTPTKEQEVESEEQLKEKEAILLAIDAVKEFNQKHGGWVYQLPSYSADNLTKPLSDLLEDIPEPESEERDASGEAPENAQ
jgi:hypothetical protein